MLLRMLYAYPRIVEDNVRLKGLGDGVGMKPGWVICWEMSVFDFCVSPTTWKESLVLTFSCLVFLKNMQQKPVLFI